MSKKKPIDPITDQEMKEALVRSGYPLEVRAVRKLRELGYYVIPNTVYTDPLTGKSRELDIWASYGHNEIDTKEDDVNFIHMTQFLFIECVNNPHPIVFFGAEKNATKRLWYDHIKFTDSFTNAEFHEEETFEPTSDVIGATHNHHSLKIPIARQYCSFEHKSDKWIATHETTHHDAFDKLVFKVNKTIEEHKKDNEEFQKELKELNGEESSSGVIADVAFYYPILLLQKEMKIAIISRDTVTLKPCSHLAYEKETAIDGNRKTALIDVVTEKYFHKYLNILLKEHSKYYQNLEHRCINPRKL
ncbi:MAG: hypothetical protein AB1405_11730 [Bdellovibrionota bacterium]